MYKKFMNAFSLMNILFQAIYSLVLPIGFGVLFSFLATKYLSAPKWIWAVLLILGTLVGLFSMIKFLLTALSGFERLEKEQETSAREKRDAKEKRERLRAELNNKESEENDS